MSSAKIHTMQDIDSRKRRLFVPIYGRKTEDGKQIVYYAPNQELVDKITIEAIDPSTGQVVEDEILFLTKHEPVDCYQVVFRPQHRILAKYEPLKPYDPDLPPTDDNAILITDDHSLVLYDIEVDKLLIESPIRIANEQKYRVNEICLLQKVNDVKLFELLFKTYEPLYRVYAQVQNKQLAQKLLEQHILLLPISMFAFVYVPEIKEAYDLTTVKTKTFSTANGLFVQDTVVVFSLHTEEAKKEAWEKMRFSQQLYSISKANDTIATLDKNMAYGWYYATMDPKQLGKKTQKHLNKGTVYKDLEHLKADFRKAGPEYTLHDLVTIEDPEGNQCTVEIGKAMLLLAIRKVIVGETQ